MAEEEMSGSHYPDFHSGWSVITLLKFKDFNFFFVQNILLTIIGRCYITTPAAVSKLLKTFEVERPSLFWIDDVWVTGFLAPQADIKLVSLNLYFTVYRY